MSFPLLVPPWSVTARRRAFTEMSTPWNVLYWPPTLSLKVRKLSTEKNFAGFTSRNVSA